MGHTLCRIYLIVGSLILAIGLPIPAVAEVALDKERRFSGYGDLRLRLESDCGATAQQSVEDRTRARFRARTGMKYQPDNWLTIDTRIRTGSDQSHQSPHVTIIDFDGNRRGDADVVLDKWYAQAKRNDLWAWAGRNSFPFWSQDEIFWDDDTTLLGVAGGGTRRVPHVGTFSASAGYFLRPAGMRHFSGTLTAAEVIYQKSVADILFNIGSGAFFFGAGSGQNALRLSNGDGTRDYTISITNARGEWKMGDIPVYAELDWLTNLERYSPSDPDPFTAANHAQKDGYVISLVAGDTAAQGHWLASYYYAYIETFAVNASYAQDEWWRFEASDFKGHQFNVGYAVKDSVNILTRLYFVESITTRQRSNRFRVDMNYSF